MALGKYLVQAVPIVSTGAYEPPSAAHKLLVSGRAVRVWTTDISKFTPNGVAQLKGTWHF